MVQKRPSVMMRKAKVQWYETPNQRAKVQWYASIFDLQIFSTTALLRSVSK
jgi:hypothetical protein